MRSRRQLQGQLELSPLQHQERLDLVRLLQVVLLAQLLLRSQEHQASEPPASLAPLASEAKAFPEHHLSVTRPRAGQPVLARPQPVQSAVPLPVLLPEFPQQSSQQHLTQARLFQTLALPLPRAPWLAFSPSVSLLPFCKHATRVR